MVRPTGAIFVHGVDMARHTGCFRCSWLLLVSALLLSPAPALAQPTELRTVTLRAAPEEMYRAQINWEATLRQTVKTVSAIYEKNFQIRLVIQDIVPWTVGPSVPINRMLTRLRAEVPTGPADIVVAFAAERCEKLQYGVAWGLERYALVQSNCLDTAVLSNTTPEAALTHEIAHLFGAFHPAAGPVSVMRAGPADRFDDQTVRVIRLMRTFDFARGVLGLDADTRRAWSAIYAEGHARDEPNLLAEALATAGWREVTSGQVAEGEARIREAMAIDPRAPHPHVLLGHLFMQQQRLEDAVRELRTATRLNFRLVEARVQLGFLLRKLNRDDEALVEFRDAVRIDPRAGRAYVGIGMILADRDRLPEAIDVLRSATQMTPTEGSAFLQLATVLAKSGRPDEAGAAAERAQKLGQAVPPALLPKRPDPVVVAAPAPGPRRPPSVGVSTPASAPRSQDPTTILATCPGPANPGADPPVSLEDDPPRFREYFAVLRTRITARWTYPRSAGERNIEGDLLIEFHIRKDGRLDCAVVRRSSGTTILDEAALDAVRLAAPYPSIPDDVAKQTLVINCTFRYQIVSGLSNAPSQTNPNPTAPKP
ncbi:MAG TPA: TonB family protein [Methylomirabilota bacterium]|nr:TonB family protein [Methylomirabilota bacterium]